MGQSILGQPLFQEMIAVQGEGIAEVVGLDGNQRLFAFSQLGGPTLSGDVYIALGILKSVAYAPAARAFRNHLIGIGLVLLLALGIAWFGIEMFIMKQVRAIVRSTRKLASGEFKYRSGLDRRSGELGQVAEAIDQMARQLEERENERARAEEGRVQLAEERSRRLRSETMLKEVHHRVKNSLQVAASLLSLQASHLRDPLSLSALRESEARIRTIASLHSKLVAMDDKVLLDFRRHLLDILPNMLQTYHVDPTKVSLQVTGDEVLLDSDTAIPCGLIVHELVSNVLKHAFPQGRKGAIHIGLRKEGERWFILTVSDDGVGLPEDLDIHTTESLGLQLVNALANQLQGTIELERNGGTTFRLKLPTQGEGRL